MKCNPRYLRKARGRKRASYLHVLYNPSKPTENFREFIIKSLILYYLIENVKVEYANNNYYKKTASRYSPSRNYSRKHLDHGFTIHDNEFLQQPMIVKQTIISQVLKYTITLNQVTIDYYEVNLLSQFVNT